VTGACCIVRGRRGFERLLRKLLRMKHQPALVVLHWCGPGRAPRGCRAISYWSPVHPTRLCAGVFAMSHKLTVTLLRSRAACGPRCMN